MLKALRNFYRRLRGSPSRSASWQEWIWDDVGLPLPGDQLEANSTREQITYAPYFQGTSLIASACARIPCNVRFVNDGRPGAVDYNHPAYWTLNKQANPLLTAHAFREWLWWAAVRENNSFAFIRRVGNTSGQGIELWPLTHQMQLTLVTMEGGETELTYIYHDERGVRYDFMPEDIFHLRGLADDGGWTGIDIKRVQAGSLGLGLGAQRFQRDYFRNGSPLGVLITGFPHLGDAQKVQEFREQWAATHSGDGRRFTPSLLGRGMEAAFPPSNARDQEVMDTRKYQRQDAASFLNLPPHKVGDETRTSYNSLEQEEKATIGQAYAPWLRRFEAEADAKLLRPREYRGNTRMIQHDPALLAPLDTERHADVILKLVQSKVITPHEGRGMLYPELPERPDENDQFENPNTSSPSDSASSTDDAERTVPESLAARMNGHGVHN